MSITQVTVEDMVDEWEESPVKLLAWLLALVWKAEINPKDSICWLAKNGKITIQNMKSIKEEIEPFNSTLVRF